MIETREAAVLGYGRAPIPLPGPSGGPCLPKDAMFLSQAFREFTAAPSRFLESVSKVHDDVHTGITDVLLRHPRPLAAAGDVTVTLLGVAFKGSPEADDVRASPAVSITEQLRARLPVKEIRSHGPVVSPQRQRDLGHHSCATVDEAVHGAQLVIIGTNHELYTGCP